MTRSTLILLAASIIVACKNKKEAAAAGTDGADAPTVVEGTPHDGVSQIGGAAAADSLVLSFERTPCFGTCKAYRVHLYRSGYATYEGRANVEIMGHAQTRVDKALIDRLLHRAEGSGFYKLNDTYDSQVTDLPSTTIRLVANGRDKAVMGRASVPENFRGLANYMEEELLPLPWKPIPAQD